MKKFLAAILAILFYIFGTQYLRENPNSETEIQQSFRVVSLAPSFTETVFELGGGAQLVGVTTYCDFPLEAQEKEKIGGFVHPNIEKIVSLKPHLVLAESSTSSRTVPNLRHLGINVLETPSPESFVEIFENIRKVGEAIEKSDPANILIQKMKIQLENIKEKSSHMVRNPSIYIEIDLPSWTIGHKSFINEALVICGGRNIFADIEMPALQVSKETIIQRNPEIILSFEATAEEIRKRPGWSQIHAVQRGKIVDDIDRNLLSHGNHRLLEGMEKLQERLLKIVN